MAERKSKTATGPKATAESDAKAAPAPENAAADAAEAVTQTEAAPLDAPEPPRQLGDPHTSTDFIAANAAVPTVPGTRHLRLLSPDGAPLATEDLFEFPPADAPATLATVRRDVIQEFLYGGATTPCTRQLYKAGARVPVDQAVRLLNALRLGAQEPAPEPRAST